MARIAQEEARAMQDVRNHAATLGDPDHRAPARDQLDGEHAQALLDGAIEEVGRKLS